MEFDRRELRVALDRAASTVAFEILNSEPAAGAACRLANISRSGMFVETADNFRNLETGAAVHFALRFDNEEDALGVARVRWVRQRQVGPHQPRGFGLQVVEFHDQAERRYLDFLESRLVQLRIIDLMDPECITVSPATPIRDVLGKLDGPRSPCVVVVDNDDTPRGIFGPAELVHVAAHVISLDNPVGAHVAPEFRCLSADEDVEVAYKLVKGGALGHFPVVEDGVLVGTLAMGDLLKHWSEFMDLQTRRLSRAYDRAMSVIAHDLRTPISLISSTNALLTSGELSPLEYVESGFPESLATSCDTMMRLIDDILDFSGLRFGAVRIEKTSVDIGLLVGRVARAFQPAAQTKRIEIRVTIEEALPRIMADSLRLEQVLNNLVSNALKYSPEASRVVIGARTLHSRVVLWVADNGPGISASELGRLFKEFGRTSNRPTGGEKSMGLGLSIVRRLVDAHGGEIEVDSKPGLGSTFTVTLPIGSLQ